MLRHMAAELKRKGSKTTILALHPGEVKTDMANVDLGWEVEGQMTPTESVSACLKVIETKSLNDSDTFWTWENEVCQAAVLQVVDTDLCEAISMVRQME